MTTKEFGADPSVSFAVVRHTGDIAILEQLGTHPNSERTGLARARLMEIKQWARSQGITKLYAQPKPGKFPEDGGRLLTMLPEVTAEARQTLVSFYLHVGFRRTGELELGLGELVMDI